MPLSIAFKSSYTNWGIIAYESSGDFLRWNPHFHSLILEGGFDEEGNFVFLPISDTSKITELLDRRYPQVVDTRQGVSSSPQVEDAR